MPIPTYQDYYAVLGVRKDASALEIKSRYRQLARKCHPDADPGNLQAAATFRQINEAYSVLIDPEKRREYDALGSETRYRQRYRRESQSSGTNTGKGAGRRSRTNNRGTRADPSATARAAGSYADDSRYADSAGQNHAESPTSAHARATSPGDDRFSEFYESLYGDDGNGWPPRDVAHAGLGFLHEAVGVGVGTVDGLLGILGRGMGGRERD